MTPVLGLEEYLNRQGRTTAEALASLPPSEAKELLERALLDVGRNAQAVGFTLGRFRLSPGRSAGRFWIEELATGEGGDFDADQLEQVLEEFYNRKF